MQDDLEELNGTPQDEDAIATAQRIVDGGSRAGSPEWLAAKQMLVDQGRAKESQTNFDGLEKEMQALRGMSEI